MALNLCHIVFAFEEGRGKNVNIVFVSNFLNHHQQDFCNNMLQQCERFVFIATDSVSGIGYQKKTDAAYLLPYYNEEFKSVCEKEICDADVVIFGGCPNNLIALRMRLHKLSFLYSERFFKKGMWRGFIPQTRKKVIDRIVRYKDEPMYVLSASAYLPSDLAMLGYPKKRCYKWGYFPKEKYYNMKKLFCKKKAEQKVSLLWVGRFIKWKHPEVAVGLALRLKRKGYKFSLKIIGGGVLEQKLYKLIEKNGLENYIDMLGEMETDKVREHMEEADIFIFTSDKNEGWGAVLNEAMNSGCAVVANHAIGSVPYLITNGENGYSYQNKKEMQQYVEILMEDQKLRYKMGKAAYQTIIDKWNAEIAAKRFCCLAESLLNTEKKDLFADGPCSKAE